MAYKNNKEDTKNNEIVNNEIERFKFHLSKSLISRNNADINKITRSNKFARSTGFQHFIG